MRIVINKLTKVIEEKKILRGRNFAGLPGEGTASPIHLLGCLIEEAKEKKKELWMMFQDIKKIYDLVGLKMLELAMKRIKLPKTTVNFILNLYKSREIEVLTSIGTTKRFVAGDGIDQEEVISLLVWRIFYDPLLTEIQEHQQK